MIGKRKRGDLSDETVLAEERLRQHFEAHFEPIESAQIEETTSETDEDVSEFNGFSEDESDSEEQVEIIDHAQTGTRSVNAAARLETRSFMSSKPPATSSTTSTPKRGKQKPSSDDEDDAAAEMSNLKNDISLQRLLQESHLLDPSSLGLSTSTKGSRRRATEIRLQALGVKKNVLPNQQKMPMSHRVGMERKRATNEQERRSQARENGVILEKQQRKEGKERKRRERGVGGPGVGKFRGGMLSLSRSDVADIVGSGKGKGAGFGRRGKTSSRRGK